MMYDYYGNNGMGDGFGLVFMFIMMVLLIGIVLLVFRHLSHNSNYTHKDDNAIEILKSRYAKGEIDKKEFDEKRKDLRV
jgi:putative membrane protein